MPRNSQLRPANVKMLYQGDLFSGGMNTVIHPTIIALNEFPMLLNVDISDSLLKKRAGLKPVVDSLGYNLITGISSLDNFKIKYITNDLYIVYKDFFRASGDYNTTYILFYHKDNLVLSFISNRFHFVKNFLNIETIPINNKIPLYDFSGYSFLHNKDYNHYLKIYDYETTILPDPNSFITRKKNSFFLNLNNSKIEVFSDDLKQENNLLKSRGFNLLNKYSVDDMPYWIEDNDEKWYKKGYIIDNYRRQLYTNIKNWLPQNEEIDYIYIPETGGVLFFTLRNKFLPFFDNPYTKGDKPVFYEYFNTADDVWGKDGATNPGGTTRILKMPFNYPNDNGEPHNNDLWKIEILSKKNAKEDDDPTSTTRAIKKYFSKKSNKYYSFLYLDSDFLSNFSLTDSFWIKKDTKEISDDGYFSKKFDFAYSGLLSTLYSVGGNNNNSKPNTFFTDEKVQRGFALFPECGNIVTNKNYFLNITENDYFTIEYITVERTDNKGNKKIIKIDKEHEDYYLLAFDVELIGDTNIIYDTSEAPSLKTKNTILSSPAYIPVDEHGNRSKCNDCFVKYNKINNNTKNIKQWLFKKYNEKYPTANYNNDPNTYPKADDNKLIESYNPNKNYWLGVRLSEKMFPYKESFLCFYNKQFRERAGHNYEKAFTGNQPYGSKIYTTQNGIKIIPYIEKWNSHNTSGSLTYKYIDAMICYNGRGIHQRQNIKILGDDKDKINSKNKTISKLVSKIEIQKNLYWRKKLLEKIMKIPFYNFSKKTATSLFEIRKRISALFSSSINQIIFNNVLLRWDIFGTPIIFHSYRNEYDYFPERNLIIFPSDEKIITLKKFLSTLLVFTDKNIYRLVYNETTPEGIAGGYFVKRVMNAGIGAKHIKGVINYKNFIFFVGNDNRVYRLYSLFSISEETNTNIKTIDDKVYNLLRADIEKDKKVFMIQHKDIIYMFVNGYCWKYYPENNKDRREQGAWSLDYSNIIKDFNGAFIKNEILYITTDNNIYEYDKNTYTDDSKWFKMGITTKSHTLGQPSNIKKFKRVYLNFKSFVNIKEDFKIYTNVKKNSNYVYKDYYKKPANFNIKENTYGSDWVYKEKPSYFVKKQPFTTKDSSIVTDDFKTPIMVKQLRSFFNEKGYSIQYHFNYWGLMPITLENYAFEYKVKKVK